MRRSIFMLIIAIVSGCETGEHSTADTEANVNTSDSLIIATKTDAEASTNMDASGKLTIDVKAMGWTFDKVVKSKLVFKEGQFFETNLFELHYIGQVSANQKAPYLIFSGRDCEGCDANSCIYIHSHSDGALIVDQGKNRYQYPGTETDRQTDSVLNSSRAFYGQVLENTPGVIWYEDRLLENGKTGHFVYLSKLGDKKQDTAYIDNGKLNETISLLKKGLCKEIPGQRYYSEP